jgi:hypothetical protein
MGTPAQRITAAVFSGLTAAVAILRIFNPADLVLVALQMFVLGAMFSAFVMLIVGPKKRV